MKDRISRFIDCKNITPGELAEMLEVQRSNISHILNGRNKPGAAFIQKFLNVFPDVNARWLLTGAGEMFFETEKLPDNKSDASQVKSESEPVYKITDKQTPAAFDTRSKEIDQIILLHSDNTFSIYNK